MSLLAVEDALQRVTAGLHPLEAEIVPLADAADRVLGQDLAAKLTQPPFASSAMDGYAVRAADTATLPISLTVIGESAAGRPFSKPLGPGQAVRIFTGAAVPEGADRIVIQEDTAGEEAGKVIIRDNAELAVYIRPKGVDFSEGDRLLTKGTVLKPRDLLLAAAMNYDQLPAIRRPHVAVLATGDELKPPGTDPLGDGQIISSIPYGLATLIEQAGGRAERLGIASLDNQPAVWLGDQWFSVVGILEPFPLAPDLDRSALIGQVAAVEYVDADPTPSTIYLRTDPDGVEEVREVLPATANPANPEEVEVSRPSDVLAARAAAEVAFTSLFLGLGAVALLVGGIGIANVMIIAVIERRGEIGLRRAMGATQAHIRRQFLTEALVLAGLGGGTGVVLGVLVTAAYSTTQGWQVVIPPVAVVGGLAAALVIGAVAGLYPAIRAARLAPTDALRTT